MMSTGAILYSFRRCPYAMRARLAIMAAGAQCELREVVLRDKPKHMLEISPKGTVPVLLLPNGEVLDESIDIMDWALAQNDPRGWLRPGVDRALIERNDGDFKHHLDRFKYPNRYDLVDGSEHRDHALTFMQTLEELLHANGNLQSVEFSYTDAAILPFVRQFSNVDRQWWNSLPYPSVHHWLNSHLESATFLAIMEKYPQWEPGESGPPFPAV